ncbi:glycosyl transferase family 1 [Croceicoccus estronivorus]|uniref:TIGR03087 family PEP-CTERM/XrtA system glycosyltransferase n=1 Tax=Croceicoccus estronivorus TaxID=1172626 RepID=UPI000833314E|nr:TIGR03087 family PEP-CTERM/XrtA system glycosyltransferase [Croceicoccus estronivorus]OCC23159.1 glycosyl transferase family 1 [Croceicoccus estronivorus]
MSGEILFLAHRMPFPPDRGDKIRSHHVLRKLASMAPVHVATFADRAEDFAHEHELAAVADSHCLVQRDKPLWKAGLEAISAREPVSLAAFRDDRIATYVRDVLATGRIDTIYVFSGQMGQYVPADFSGQVLMDLVDVDSAKFEAYGKNGLLHRRWINAREGRLLRAEEEKLAHRANHTLFVSEQEVRLFQLRLSEPAGVQVSPLCNGIDADYFDPAKVGISPDFSAMGWPRIVFTGQMDYPPNIAAALRLMTNILPELRKSHPHAECHIVGRNPPPALLAYDGKMGCRVWGEVADVRPYLAGADMVIIPLEIARGVQNKVLEAMAMARPVLLTPEAAVGIDGQDKMHFVVGQGDEELVACARVLTDRHRMAAEVGQAARQFVIETRGWDAALAPLEALVRPSRSKQERRNAA